MSNNPGTVLDAFFTKPVSRPQAQATGSVAETTLIALVGAGTLSGAWYVPDASSQPSTGANSCVLSLNIYDANNNLLGVVAQGTLQNSSPMLPHKRFPLTVVATGIENYSDGYVVTALTLSTGTCTLPPGIWEIAL